MDFYKSSPARCFNNNFDKNGFNAFITEWYSLYDKALLLDNTMPKIDNITFEDYDTCTDNEVLGINEEGISLTNFRFINFRECEYNFKQSEGGSGKCIGERDITDYSFTFYTSPKPIMIVFIEKNKFIEFISKKNTISRFNKLQKQIMKYGYSTRDMS